MALIAHWKLDETSGNVVDDTGNVPDGVLQGGGTPVYGLTGLDGTAINMGGAYFKISDHGQLGGVGAAGQKTATVEYALKASAMPAANFAPFGWDLDGTAKDRWYTLHEPDGTFHCYVWYNNTWQRQTTSIGHTFDGEDFVTFKATLDFDAEECVLYVDGQVVASSFVSQYGWPASLMPSAFRPGADLDYYIGTNFVPGGADRASVTIDNVRVWDTVEASTSIGPVPSSLGMSLVGTITAAASSLPMSLEGAAVVAASSIPLRLESADPDHYAGTVAHWRVSVELAGTDVSSDVVGAVSIDREEDASTLADFTLLPAAGTIDPDAYERKPVKITFVGLDESGATLYTVRRFTGTTTVASYNPDTGRLAITATTDLQGRLETMSRATIAALVGGRWSEHVFDDAADGWQYAQDRLSTLASEMHVNNYGQLVVVPWAAKATPAGTFTDAARFNDTLRVTRASRRDLLSRVQINMDFRFVRLRQREITCTLSTPGFCHYLNNGWEAIPRDTVRSAADTGAWTRVSEIAYTALPGVGEYCTPLRGWPGGAETFCLGASWKMARRWAQTVTEEYQLTVVAPDLAETAGEQQTSEDYGIEATYDGTDFENIVSFQDRPSGATLSPKTGDWQAEATEAEADGRAAMELAQACVLDKAHATILGRARGNRVTASVVYDPTVTLEDTRRINTPYLVATGKVARVSEVLDTGINGGLSMEVELAISRHGGSGSAIPTTREAADQPDQPEETITARTYGMYVHIGGVTNAPADDDEWDGWITNTSGSARIEGEELYRTRLVVRMPEIEAAARDAQSLAQAAEYEVEIPEDELTLGA
jgi:hypothetical protein